MTYTTDERAGTSIVRTAVASELCCPVAPSTASIVAAAVLYAILTGLSVFVDVALAIALITFVGTVALAHAIESGGRE